MMAHARSFRAAIAVLVAAGLVASFVDAKPAKRKKKAAAPAPALAPEPAVAPPAAERVEVPSGSIEVTVVEVAGNQAYLTPGTKGGVRRGAKVTFGGKEYEVAQATDSFAAIVVGDDAPREKAKGAATRVDESQTRAVELPKPVPVAKWQNQWTDPVPPSSRQSPRFVPLGETVADHRIDVQLSASGGALLPLGTRGSNLYRAEIDARLHAEPFTAPAAFDVDFAVQRWFDPNLSTRPGSASRPTLFVRELAASYGAGGPFFGALGRLRYAASTLGTLDGARASAEVGGGFSVGAFGGLLPNPLSGAPSVAGNRFGVEATYSRPESDLRPEAALVVHGSTFDGKLDERRLSGVVALYPGPSRFGAHFQVSGFDASNPWKANAVELTEAGFDSSVRAGVFEFGGRFDVRQPERSRWLASYLPVSWLCNTVPGTPGGTRPEPCDGKVNTLAYGSIDAGVLVDRVSLYLGATTMGDLTASGVANSVGGFATGRVVRIADLFRVEASGAYSRGTYLNMVSGSAGPGVTLLRDALDVSIYYRLASLEYRSASTSLVQHAAGSSVLFIPEPSLLFAVQGEAIAGDDTKALVLFGTATWRPRF